MWHAFTTIPSALSVAAELRSAAPPLRGRLSYSEQVVRWFKEKEGETYKQPIMDPGPGWQLDLDAPADGRRRLRFRLERTHDARYAMEGTMTHATTGWRSPLLWQFKQSFLGAPSPLLPDLRETGRWEHGTVHRHARAGDGTMATTVPAPALLFPLTWLAQFPFDLGLRAWSDEVVVMEDLTLFTRGVALEPAGAAPTALPLAAGLRGVVLRFGGGLPYEFWVNEHGLVVYLCAGPTRVFVLNHLENLS